MVTYDLQVVEDMEFFKPSSYRVAITTKEANVWIAAMSEEMESLHKNRTWELDRLLEPALSCWMTHASSQISL